MKQWDIERDIYIKTNVQQKIEKTKYWVIYKERIRQREIHARIYTKKHTEKDIQKESHRSIYAGREIKINT